MKFSLKLLLINLVSLPLLGAVINEKVLICGVAKNVEHAIPNTIRSIEELGNQFLDYTVIIYENNSKDRTKQLFSAWAIRNPKVLFLSENLTDAQLRRQLHMHKVNRTECIARARNIVLDQVMDRCYDSYKYVIMADLDFSLMPWDVPHIVDSILYPECEWDGVLANGSYDEFALRTTECPIGYELSGHLYEGHDEKLKQKLKEADFFNPEKPWHKVYSAFGGLGIYKRESIRGCRYSGVVTKDLEKVAYQWLQEANQTRDVLFLEEYNHLLATLPIFDLRRDCIARRNKYPEFMGLRLKNKFGDGKVVWFSCDNNCTLPFTCEHIPFHASMILKGKDKLFINPKLTVNHDP